MILEQPKINSAEPLAERVAYLERYLYRLTAELQMAITAMEKVEKGDGKI